MRTVVIGLTSLLIIWAPVCAGDGLVSRRRLGCPLAGQSQLVECRGLPWHGIRGGRVVERQWLSRRQRLWRRRFLERHWIPRRHGIRRRRLLERHRLSRRHGVRRGWIVARDRRARRHRLWWGRLLAWDQRLWHDGLWRVQSLLRWNLCDVSPADNGEQLLRIGVL